MQEQPELPQTVFGKMEELLHVMSSDQGVPQPFNCRNARNCLFVHTSI